MKLSDLKALADQDLTIDETVLDSKSMELPRLQGKWQSILLDLGMEMKALMVRLDELKADRWVFYRRDYDLELNVHEIRTMVEGDEEIIRLKAKLYTCEQKVDFVEGVIKSLNQMSFNIKNAIEWQRFKNGLA